jgi:hypothetical protein
LTGFVRLEVVEQHHVAAPEVSREVAPHAKPGPRHRRSRDLPAPSERSDHPGPPIGTLACATTAGGYALVYPLVDADAFLFHPSTPVNIENESSNVRIWLDRKPKLVFSNVHQVREWSDQMVLFLRFITGISGCNGPAGAHLRDPLIKYW